MEVRTATRDDRDAILRLSERSDSTPRAVETWGGNPIQAVLAFDDGQLIGMLPLEERTWETGRGNRLEVLWATGVHVDAAYRGKGIGGRLDAFAERAFAGRFDAFCVFREDETSPAYNWYRKNGYHPQAHIRAYRLPVDAGAPAQVATRYGHRHLTSRRELEETGRELSSTFDALGCGRGGFLARTPASWVNIWDHHYYRAFYRYSVLALLENAHVVAFALLGETSMRDGINRYDILEFAAADGDAENNLHAAVVAAARQAGLRDIRMQVFTDDRRSDWMQGLGYVDRDRSTNILGKLLAPERTLKGLAGQPGASWTWRTERWGDVGAPNGSADGTMAASDAALTAFYFQRLSTAEALRAGDIRWQGPGTAPAASIDAAPWRYCQADYI